MTAYILLACAFVAALTAAVPHIYSSHRIVKGAGFAAILVAATTLFFAGLQQKRISKEAENVRKQRQNIREELTLSRETAQALESQLEDLTQANKQLSGQLDDARAELGGISTEESRRFSIRQCASILANFKDYENIRTAFREKISLRIGFLKVTDRHFDSYDRCIHAKQSAVSGSLTLAHRYNCASSAIGNPKPRDFSINFEKTHPANLSDEYVAERRIYYYEKIESLGCSLNFERLSGLECNCE